MTVLYSEHGEKKYQFPKVFESFLIIDDESLQKEIQDELLNSSSIPHKIRQPVKETQTKDSVEAAGNSSELSVFKGFDKKNGTFRSGRNSRRDQNKHLIPRNIAFKCTYNDGGRNENGIGFIKVCSDSLIRQHIHDGRRWCSTPGCPCYQYANGILTRMELDALRASRTLICYECCMLDEWKAQAGTIRNGLKEGENIKIKNAFKNSIAILTTRLPGTTEKERFIFGLFLIDDLYEGDEDTSGYVSAQSRFRLFFTIEEGRKLPYWRYLQIAI